MNSLKRISTPLAPLLQLVEKGTLRRMSRNAGLTLSSGIAMSVFAIVRLLLLTGTFPVVDYGRLVIAVTLFLFLQLFWNIRVDEILFQYLVGFKSEGRVEKVRGLVGLASGLGLTAGVMVCGATFLLAPWISRTLYNDPQLELLIRIFAVGALPLFLFGFASAILRIHDRFAWAVLPQVFGHGLAVALMAIYLPLASEPRLWVVAALWAAAQVIQGGVPLILALHCLQDERNGRLLPSLRQVIREDGGGIGRTLFQSNLNGYLKAGADSGGLFLLGILGGPTQVAIYDVARQLVGPVKLVASNGQAVVSPEVSSLWVKGKKTELIKLTRFLVLLLSALSVAFVIAGFGLIQLAISLPVLEEYRTARDVFLILLIANLLSLVSMPFYPLAIMSRLLWLRNALSSLRIVFLAITCLIGLTALSLAVVQVLGALVMRFGADIAIYRHLRRWEPGPELAAGPQQSPLPLRATAQS